MCACVIQKGLNIRRIDAAFHYCGARRVRHANLKDNTGVLISLFSSFIVVLIFRTILQIKTPINIWLYQYFPENIEVFMKIYF